MIVLGLGFGDEGKGATTSYLCAQTNNPIVVRFNGGHQAGHTVNIAGIIHTFSSFGSGTLQGVPTYWSKYCTVYPPSFMREYEILSKHTDRILMYMDPLCPITTPFDIDANRHEAKRNSHGSVGMGFGETIRRQENYYKLFVQDIMYPNVLRTKLLAIMRYYGCEETEDQRIMENFIDDVHEFARTIMIADSNVLRRYTPIMEGAQGILLDMDYGFFPHVTRSNTTSKNALDIYPDAKEVYYVTRSYLTRHGNGPMPGCTREETIINPHETNKLHPYQGHFRAAELSLELIDYALDCDHNHSAGLIKNLVITCADVVPVNVDMLTSHCAYTFNKIFVSHGPTMADMKQVR